VQLWIVPVVVGAASCAVTFAGLGMVVDSSERVGFNVGQEGGLDRGMIYCIEKRLQSPCPSNWQ